jgi:hypothetical protein
MADYGKVIKDIEDELDTAIAEHGPMHSGHEGYAVILEELDELWDEVKKRNQDKTAMYLEAKQTATMAIRFMIEVC